MADLTRSNISCRVADLDGVCVAPEDDVLMPHQDFTSILPDPTIGVVLFSFQMHRSSLTLSSLFHPLPPYFSLTQSQTITVNYKQLCKAFNYLSSNPLCQLILTNDDHTVMLANGGVCPGEGAMASVLFGARKGLIPLIIGKPHPELLNIVQTAYVSSSSSFKVVLD